MGGGKKRIYFSLERLIIVIIVIAISAFSVRAVDNFRNQDKSPCPEEMVFVPSSDGGFCIDKYENSPSADCSYPFPMNQEDTRVNLEDRECKPISQAGKRPWTYVSRDQAQNLCALAGKRLPSASEWHLAALGTWDSDAFNTESCQLENNWDKQPGAVGQNEDCKSAAGAYDMIGNVWEWVSDEVVEGKIDEIKLPEPGYIQSMSKNGLPILTANEFNPDYNQDYFWIKPDGIKAVAKGGYYGSGVEGGRFSTYVEASPDFKGQGIGFRCAR